LFSITVQGLTVGKLVQVLTGRCPQAKVVPETHVAETIVGDTIVPDTSMALKHVPES
jgi:hypothetical protein